MGLRLRLIRPIVALGCASLAAALIAGCNANDNVVVPTHAPKSRMSKVDTSLDSLAAVRKEARPAVGTARPAPTNPNPEISTLLDQTQRDIQTVLAAKAALAKKNSQDAGHGSEGAWSDAPEDSPLPKPESLDKAGDASSPGSSVPPGPRTVLWNDTAHRAEAGKAASQAAPQVHQPALLRDPVATPEPAASQPALTLEPDRLKNLMVDLSRELYASGAYSDMPLKQLTMIAAMTMLDQQRTLDPQAIPDLTEKERELLGKLQVFFSEIGKGLDGKGETEQAVVDAVNHLRDSLVRQPQLKIATAALCTRVGGFSDFSEFQRMSAEGVKTPPVYTFLAHSEQKVIVYLEIGDFTSVTNEKGEYVTHLSQQLTIYSDRDGIPVWKEDWQAAVDVTKNKRQDFFTIQVVTLPKALSVGKYQLKIRVRDEKSQAETESFIPFEMVADPKMISVASK